MYDVIIIGAGPAGISASLYAKRANKSVLVIYYGESQLEKAHLIDNYYGFDGGISAETHSDVIRKACDILEELMVDYFQNGKINPASGIFLMKNMFQYRDVQDVVLTPNQPIQDAQDPAQIAERYDLLEDPDQK